MKYVLYYDTTDAAKAAERVMASRAIGKKMKEEEKKLKAVTPSYSHADLSGGVQIVETDDIEELVGMIAFYHGATKIRAVPIIELDRLMWIADEVNKILPEGHKLG
jgi:hypothetical protein